MTLDEYQTAAARTLNESLSQPEKLLDGAAGAAEEAGEVLAHVRKHVFQKRDLDRRRLAEELGDLLWCVAAVAGAAGLSLDAIAHSNIEKLRARHPDGLRT